MPLYRYVSTMLSVDLRDQYDIVGEKGEGRTTFKPLHYKGTPIHRIVKGFIIQGGDFSEGKAFLSQCVLMIWLSK